MDKQDKFLQAGESQDSVKSQDFGQVDSKDSQKSKNHDSRESKDSKRKREFKSRFRSERSEAQNGEQKYEERENQKRERQPFREKRERRENRYENRDETQDASGVKIDYKSEGRKSEYAHRAENKSERDKNEWGKSESKDNTDSKENKEGRKWIGENTLKNNKKIDERHDDGTRKVIAPLERGNVSFHKDLKRGVESNNKIHKTSLNPHFKLDLDTNAKVRITPLGGLGEIGGNMTVMETEKSAIIIDIGMSFPDDNMPGVDILVPDFSYIESIKDKIVAVIITHAHEDHIGAVPYFYKRFQFPLYGTPLSLGLVGNKFDEHGLKKCKELFHIIEKRKPVRISDFEIEWIHITHSIIDSSALAIRTQAGVIIHTGDFKIDHTPVDDLPTDLHRLAHYGEEGVMLLLSDSTNSHKPGVTPSESSVGPTFDNLFKDATGRVIMSTFSSNIHRVHQAIKYGLKYKRKIAVIGRSMEKNLDIARELGYINLPSNIFIEAHEVGNYPDDEILIVTTGSQGETMSALYRMASDEHRHIKLKHTDFVILSAKAIPGNEGSVSAVINLIIKSGARVAYQDFSEIHVSGHAAQEEQKLMLRLIKPKFFLPVHGEYNHISKHKQTAIACGVPEKNIYLMEDGDQIEVNPNYMRKVRSVKTGKTYIDNQVNRILHDDIIAERNLIANDGIFILTMLFSKESKEILESRTNVFGITGPSEEGELNKIVLDELRAFLANAKENIFDSAKNLESNIFGVIKKILLRKYKRRPAILINAMFDTTTSGASSGVRASGVSSDSGFSKGRSRDSREPRDSAVASSDCGFVSRDSGVFSREGSKRDSLFEDSNFRESSRKDSHQSATTARETREVSTRESGGKAPTKDDIKENAPKPVPLNVESVFNENGTFNL